MFNITDYTKPIVDFSNFEISSLGDALAFGGSILLIGMSAIFLILCVLWICLTLFKVFLHDIPEKKASKKVVTTNVVTVEEHEEEKKTEDTEIIAVIAAAIAMAESEHSDQKFRVVSFRRV